MKTLIVYSSLTGNTKKVAEAIAAVLPGCDLLPVEEAPASVEGYDLVALGAGETEFFPQGHGFIVQHGIHDGLVFSLTDQIRFRSGIFGVCFIYQYLSDRMHIYVIDVECDQNVMP